MKAKEIKFNKDGLFVDEKKYGYGISKVEFTNMNTIRVYTTKERIKRGIINMPKDMHYVKDLKKYENIFFIYE